MPERVSSGIPGLDELMEGGFFKGSVNLITGATGTCKTIFGLQYIWEGLQKGENGVYISLEQEPEDIFADVEQFGWNFDSYIKRGKCIVENLPTWKLEELPVLVSDKVGSVKAKRFVLDTLSLVCSRLDPVAIRSEITEFLKELKRSGATSILLSEIPEGAKTLSRFGIEEFLADGIIILHFLDYSAGNVPRSLTIRKMRRTNHGTDIYPLKITKKGLVIKK
jgi:KaiC/GvpD/RAD55 family RecA-like ATPase